MTAPSIGNRDLIDVTSYASIRARKPLLIAHRGGVIAPNAPECSLAAIQLAAVHGYDMVELDVQETRDRQPILFHDLDLIRACGRDGAIRNLTSREVSTLYYRASDQSVATLGEALALCRSLNLSVMLDIKTFEKPPSSEEFFQCIGKLLTEHELDRASITFSNHPLTRTHLGDKALFAVSKGDFKDIRCGVSIPLEGQFWFGVPEELPSGMVKMLQQNGALVIPAINTFRYPSHAHRELAQRDMQRLLEIGVDGFQIDSVYEGIFRVEIGRGT